MCVCVCVCACAHVCTDGRAGVCVYVCDVFVRTVFWIFAHDHICTADHVRSHSAVQIAVTPFAFRVQKPGL